MNNLEDKMEDLKVRLEKLNILEKLLDQDLVTFKKSLGDSIVLRTLSDVTKSFLKEYMEGLLSGNEFCVSKKSQQFTPEVAAILNEFANRLLAKAGLQEVANPPLSPPVVPPPAIKQPGNAHVEPIRRKSVRVQGSPVLDALHQKGFDPDMSSQDRIKAVKKMEKEKKVKK